MSSSRGASSSPSLPAAGYQHLSSPESAAYSDQSGAARHDQQPSTLLQNDPFEACFDASLSTPSRMAAASAIARTSNDPSSRPAAPSIPALTSTSWNTANTGSLLRGSSSSGDPQASLFPTSSDASGGTSPTGLTGMREGARHSSLPIFAPNFVSSPIVSSASPTWSTGAGGPSVGVSSVNIPQQFAQLSISSNTATSRATPDTSLPSSIDGASASITSAPATRLQSPQRLSLNPFRNRILQQQEQQQQQLQQQQQQQQQQLLISPVQSPSETTTVQAQSQPPAYMTTEYIPPPWQPDSEVSACPICHHEFSFWYRKHHCRKCGRVVCANCSPHRITIPRQYIVRPPTREADSPRLTTPGLTGAANGNVANVRKRGSLDFLTSIFDNQEVPSTSQRGGASSSAAGLQGQNQPSSERPTPSNDSLFSYFSFNQRPANQSSALFAAGTSTSVNNPALGGGEEVRLCNPCVPDPNLEPPTVPSINNQSMNTVSGLAQSSVGDSSRHLFPEQSADGGRRSTDSQTGEDGRSRHSSLHNMPSALAYHPYSRTDTRPRSTSTPIQHTATNQTFDSMLANFDFNERRPRAESRRHHFTRHGDDRHHDSRGGRSLPALATSAISSRLTRGRHHRSGHSISNHQHSRPDDHTGQSTPRSTRHRRRIPEEDICPVCSRPLPPRGPDGSETPREEHISACIENTTAALTSETSSGSATVNRPGLSAPNAVGTSLSQTTRGSEGPSMVAVASSPGTGRNPRCDNPHLMRMLSFKATEKDCCQMSDGSPQECSICMEEYSMGEELARLECLCKFHKKCIIGWFTRKPECPVHKTPSWEEP